MMLFSIALVALSTAGVVQSLPSIGRKPLDFSAYQPVVAVNHQVFGTENGVSYLSTFDASDIALTFAADQAPGVQFVITDKYDSSNGVTHMYLKQTVNGIKVQNGDMNINIYKGKVVNFGESIYKGTDVVASKPTIKSIHALQSVAEFLGSSDRITMIKEDLFSSPMSMDNIPVELMYVQTDNGLELCWRFVVHQVENWLDIYVSSTSGRIVSVFDWMHKASYEVYPIGVNDPSDGDRSLIINPQSDGKGSPLGWHDTGKERYTTTRGNNVIAHENLSGKGSYETKYRPDAGAFLNFTYPLDLSKEPVDYLDASITNLFYWNNIMHDVFYEYGFDEVSGNFQENNFNKGGKEGDAVIANAQDGSGINNAAFGTPPDGSKPTMYMYLWNNKKPYLDGDLDNGIIIHEYAHGISTRLTGGPSNTGCLRSGQSGGMGEGWGDTFSVFLRWRPNYSRKTSFGMGEYAAGRGIRPYPYSENLSTNPQVFSFINGASYGGVHAKGSVWAQTLFEVFLNVIDDQGFDPDWYKGKGGNNQFLKDIVDGMKLQPCSPNFVQARDAILLADEINFNGRNYCSIWRGFAKRGLGVNADAVSSLVRDSFQVPLGC